MMKNLFIQILPHVINRKGPTDPHKWLIPLNFNGQISIGKELS